MPFWHDIIWLPALFCLAQALSVVQITTDFSSCSFQKSLYCRFYWLIRTDNKNCFQKCKCCQKHKHKDKEKWIKMEAEECDNVIRHGENHCKNNAFWKTRVEIQSFRLLLELRLQKSGIQNPEGRNLESRRSEARIQNRYGFCYMGWNLFAFSKGECKPNFVLWVVCPKSTLQKILRFLWEPKWSQPHTHFFKGMCGQEIGTKLWHIVEFHTCFGLL